MAGSSCLVIVWLALFIMSRPGSIQQAWYISGRFGAGIGLVLVLRWLWERINVFSVFAAMGTALVVAPILPVITDQEW